MMIFLLSKFGRFQAIEIDLLHIGLKGQVGWYMEDFVKI